MIPGPAAPSAIAFSLDCRLLAIGYRDGFTRLCHVDSSVEIFQCRRRSRPIAQLACSGDGVTLAVTDGIDSVQQLDLAGLRRGLIAVGIDW